MSRSTTPFRQFSYDEVLASITASGHRTHLLTGNGFSVGCNELFSYESLYQKAIDAGLSARARLLFERLGTNNFEGVLRLLDDSEWVARTYELLVEDGSEMMTDSEAVKAALVSAISHSHIEHSGILSDQVKQKALTFLQPYFNVFTTNYDLILYWVNMFGQPPPFDDFFRTDPDDLDARSLVFTEPSGREKSRLYYLHGALHLFTEGGRLRKHSWTRSGVRLTDLVRQGLNEGRYPLFVAEGTPAKKLEQIGDRHYLSYCLAKFGRIKKTLVVFGHALGPSDGHLASAIAGNHDLEQLYVGLYGDPESQSSLEIRSSARAIADRRLAATATGRLVPPLQIDFYDSSGVDLWSEAS